MKAHAGPKKRKTGNRPADSGKSPLGVVCFASACVFVLVGAAVIVRAMVIDQSAVLTVVGGVCSTLFWPSLAHARRIRKENQALRLLEIPLSKAETAEAAANMIREMFIEVFVHRKG